MPDCGNQNRLTMYNCKKAPSSSYVASRTKKTVAPPKPKKKTPWWKGKQELCKFKGDEDGYGRIHIIYKDNTWRYKDDDGNYDGIREWQIAYSNLGPMFLSRNFDVDDNSFDDWDTAWNSGDKDEIKLAETIVRALGNEAVEDMLKGKFDDKASDNPA